MHFPRPTIIAGLLALGATAAPTEVDPVLFTYTLSFTNSCSKNNFLNPLEFRRSQLPSNGCLVWSDFMGTNQPLKSFTVLETISNGVCSIDNFPNTSCSGTATRITSLHCLDRSLVSFSLDGCN